ncbi:MULTISPECIES: carboxylate-amine ligase [Streptomyces]|uniref:Putative glutamate--cysteine ligase 2 n=2 Tax=Streptomyces TaxID=1883 RepID=A0A3S9PBU7_STRLT|nr:glutamate--cysteine ligase [Streptomyces luteoverticillatus]AZQ69859.1 YbdK family carboxylate-amine ligase [Streptomyces luteoverticillatus]
MHPHPAEEPPTIGVEEEFFLVHPGSRRLVAAGARVVARASAELRGGVSGEFTEFQVEGRTPPCSGPQELRGELRRARAALAAAARAEGLRLCASGTPVLADDSGTGTTGADIGDHPRYRAGLLQYRRLLDQFVLCAFHAHVHLPDRETAVLVSNHLRPWLPLLVAMSANSPYHHGQDTGYASWRAVIRSCFPCLGPPPYAASLDEYGHLATAMAATEAMLEPGMPFWDVRPNPHLPTLEVRTMDVLPDTDDTVAMTLIIRALVTTAASRVADGDPGPRVGAELLRAAYWRAARDGWPGQGLDTLTGHVLPSSEQAQRLVDDIRPALHAYGDEDEVTAFLHRLRQRGSGAERQRARMTHEPHLSAVVDGCLVQETCADGCG